MRTILSIVFLTIFYNLSSHSVVKDSIISEPQTKNYRSAILLGGQVSPNSKALNAKYFGDFILKQDSKYGIGFNLCYGKIWLTNSKKNISVDLMLGSAGLNIRAQLTDQLFFQPEFSVLIGKEKVTELIYVPASYNQYGYVFAYKTYEKNTEKDVLGMHLEQHLFYYPRKAKNLILGISIFERLSNAKYYDGDFGACAYLGIDF